VTNLFQPWILLRIASAITIAVLFTRAASTSLRVLRHFDVARSNEGQLLLERRLELAATYARVAAVAAAFDLGLGVLTADRLSRSLHGAMCAYGVFGANPLGWLSLGLSVALALAGGLLAQLYAFDATLPRLDLARPIAVATALAAPRAIASAVVATAFLLGLDLTAQASCCSVELDGAAVASGLSMGTPRAGLSLGGAVSVIVAALAAALVARRPTRRRLGPVAATALVAGALGTTAVILGVAPHAFETPHHLCPFCLLRFDVHAIGYPLFGAISLGVVWGLGAAVGAWLTPDRRRALPRAAELFARIRLRRSALAWCVALALGAGPVLRYAWLSGGTLLFP
jgi:hypothetical protein